MQTVYQVDFNAALAGQLADEADLVIDSYPANEAIAPGLVVVLSADGIHCELPKTAGALATSGPGSIIGIAAYKAMAPTQNPIVTPTGYQIGDIVQVVRRGRVWASFSGTGPVTDSQVLNVRNPSTGTITTRGMVTDAATSTVAGSEVSVMPALTVAREQTGGATGIVKMAINLA